MNLSSAEINILKDIIESIIDDNQSIKVYLFGSRANETNKKYSDVDILLDSAPEFSINQMAQIKEQLEESKTPFIFDFVQTKDLYENYFKAVNENKTLLFEIRPQSRINS